MDTFVKAGLWALDWTSHMRNLYEVLQNYKLCPMSEHTMKSELYELIITTVPSYTKQSY